jgi:hypothetical protein
MQGNRRRQRPALLELQELRPCGPVPAAATTKPFPPDALHHLPEASQRNAVTRDPIATGKQ